MTSFGRMISDIATGGRTRGRGWVASAAIFLTLGVTWRAARFLSCPPLWGDEAFIAVNVLARDFSGMLKTLEYYQIVPLGFLWVEQVMVKLFGGSEWSLRAVPFVSGIAAFLLYARFVSRTLDRRSALLAVGIMAASYYPARHGNEVKPYSTDLLFGLVSTMLAWSIRNDPNRKLSWIALTLVIAIGVWCSYPLVFVAAGISGFLAWSMVRQPHPRAIGYLVGHVALIGASWVAAYVTFARPQALSAPWYSRLETWQGAFPPWDRPWMILPWLINVHTGNMLAYPYGGNHLGSIATALLVAVGIARLWRTRRDLVVLWLSPLVPMMVASCFKLYPYGTSARTTLFMAPAICGLAGIGASTLIRKIPDRSRRLRWSWYVGSTLALSMAAATIGNLVLPYKNYEDMLNRRAVEALAAMSNSGDRWLVTDGLDARLESRREILEHWVQQVAEVRYNILADAPGPTAWLPDQDAPGPAPGGATWLIVHRSGCPGFDKQGVDDVRDRLRRRFGDPVERKFTLTKGESITAYRFDGDPRVEQASLGDRRRPDYDGSRPASAPDEPSTTEADPWRLDIPGRPGHERDHASPLIPDRPGRSRKLGTFDGKSAGSPEGRGRAGERPPSSGRVAGL